jgi:PTS system N-acetylglucosamine-specific IIC component
VSFVTGITEPLEFAFMFVAPVLYGIHALLTGMSAWLTNSLGLRHGFGFSAGLIDYGLNFGLASGPITLAGLMLAFGALYFGVFYSAIRLFNLKTPGREDEIAETPATDTATAVDAGRAGAGLVTNGRSAATGMVVGADKHSQQAAAILAAIGGAANVVAVDNCATRLRLTVQDSGQVNEREVKATGAMGVVKPSKTAVQVIVGVQSQFVADRMKEQLASAGTVVATEPVISAPAAAPTPRGPIIPGDVLTARTQQFVQALGGPTNINDVQVAAGTRLRVVVRDGTKIDTAALRAAGALGVMPLRDAVHVLVGVGADQYAADMQGRLLERAVG